MGLIAGQITLY